MSSHEQIAVLTVFKAISQSLVTIIPMVLFQGYGYYRHCGLSEGRTGELDRPWCNARIPYLYGFVQDYYWYVLNVLIEMALLLTTHYYVTLTISIIDSTL